MSTKEYSHIPVLKAEMLKTFDYLKDRIDPVFVDGTVGLGGHSLALASEFKPKTQNQKLKIIGIDRDEEAIKISKIKYQTSCLPAGKANIILIHDNFENIDQILEKLKINKIDGMLLDLGVSSMQLDDRGRGFSFIDLNAPLDMRMDRSNLRSAKDIVNSYSISELERVLKDGEEKYYKKIARNIAEVRKEKKIESIGDLLEILQTAIPLPVQKKSKNHFATDTFRALRIETNNELSDLERTIEKIINFLKPKSRLAIITFHSQEDRIVKKAFQRLENPCTCPPKLPYCVCGNKPKIRLVNKKPIVPSSLEIEQNPSARSAKLRVAEKI